MKKNLLILFGGESSEHEVSEISAYNVIKAIDTDEYNIFKIGITKKGIWYLYEGDNEFIKGGKWEQFNNKRAFISPCKSYSGIVVENQDKFEKIPIDVCYPVLHGKNGEDGTIQGLLTLAGIKFVGCGCMSSALCMDKVMAKMIFEENGIPHTPYVYMKKGDNIEEFIKEVAEKIGYPCFVKPSNAGSSVGAKKVKEEAELFGAINDAFCHDYKVLVEKFINCREIETAVMGNFEISVAGPGEITSESEFYDYDTKYITNSNVGYVIPADLSASQTHKIVEYAKKAYKALDCKGLSRIDFFLSKDDGEIYLNEINTLPGFTDISMYPKLFMSEGVSYKTIVSELLKNASL